MRGFGILLLILGTGLLAAGFLADPELAARFAAATGLAFDLARAPLQAALLASGGAVLIAGAVFIAAGRLAGLLLAAAEAPASAAPALVAADPVLTARVTPSVRPAA